MKAVTLISF